MSEAVALEAFPEYHSPAQVFQCSFVHIYYTYIGLPPRLTKLLDIRSFGLISSYILKFSACYRVLSHFGKVLIKI